MRKIKKFILVAMASSLLGCGISDPKSQASELMAAINVNLQEVFRGAGHTFSDLHTQESSALSRATAGNSGEFFSPTTVIGARFSKEIAGAVELDMNLEQLPRFLREQLRFILARYPKSTFVLFPEQRPGEAKSVRLSVVNGQKQAVFSLRSSKESFESTWNHGDSKANDPFSQQISEQKNAVFSLGEQPLSNPEQNIIKNAFSQKTESIENLEINWKVKANGLSMVNITEPDFDGKAGPLQSEIQASRLKEKLRKQKLQQQEESQKKEQGLEQKFAQEQTDHGQTRKERDGLADDKKDLVEKKETLTGNLATAQEDVTRLRGERDQKEDQRAAAVLAKNQAEATLVQKETQRAVAQADVTRLTGELDTAQKEAQARDTQINALTDERNQKEAQRAAAVLAKKQEKADLIVQAEDTINRIRKERQKARDERDAFQEQLDNAQQAREKLITLAKKKIANIKKNLKKQIEELTKERDKARKELVDARKKIDEDDEDEKKLDIIDNDKPEARDLLISAYLSTIYNVLSEFGIIENKEAVTDKIIHSTGFKDYDGDIKKNYKKAITFLENIYKFWIKDGDFMHSQSRMQQTYCSIKTIDDVLFNVANHGEAGKAGKAFKALFSKFDPVVKAKKARKILNKYFLFILNSDEYKQGKNKRLCESAEAYKYDFDKVKEMIEKLGKN